MTQIFGYIKVCQPELKMKDYEIYRGVYCSLCKQLGHDYGVFARLTLNYDFTMLALARLAFSPDCCGFENSRCTFRPTKKCLKCVHGSEQLSFAAAAAMIMCCYKVLDNINDSRFFKKIAMYLLLPYFSLKHKKAVRLYPQIEQIISSAMARQAQVEKENAGVDRSADPSAKAMGELLSLGFDGETGKGLNRLGYFIGRWVYLMDALDDMESDKKTGSYNVFNNREMNEKETREYATGVLNLTTAQLTREYKALSPLRFGSILDNIVDEMGAAVNRQKEETK